jgi:hypothetical protein
MDYIFHLTVAHVSVSPTTTADGGHSLQMWREAGNRQCRTADKGRFCSFGAGRGGGITFPRRKNQRATKATDLGEDFLDQLNDC